ncbi:hypothetical protein FHY31_003951 [Xanthomonas euvesicatoria]|uniref:Uncharacterized protein n=1 Tax=Xanthomonas euvesicatoria TaxID=456327 RepID=A0AAW3U8P7_XANEU|nr:hypothetical protein [Xanthomonas euvesicatoria]MBB4872141.1 hypothetical protein [Xanthomonas euvesicatoria]
MDSKRKCYSNLGVKSGEHEGAEQIQQEQDSCHDRVVESGRTASHGLRRYHPSLLLGGGSSAAPPKMMRAARW